jgi:CII-binding regulator of phage lambda lysogenization HflD
MTIKIYWLTCLLTGALVSQAQPEYQLTDKMLDALSDRAGITDKKILSQTEKYLDKMEKLERSLRRKCEAKDSSVAKNVFANSDAYYGELRQKIHTVNSPFSNVYSSKLDSLKTGLSFLSQSAALKNLPGNEKIKAVLSRYEELQSTLNRTEGIKKHLLQRQQELKAQLAKLNIPGLKKLEKQVYYYRARMDEYKRMWEDPVAMENKLLGLLRKIPEFGRFFDQYSGLGSVFQLNGNTNALANPNLQTRSYLNSFVQATRGATLNIQSQVQNNLPSQANGLPQGLLPSGNGGEEMSSFTPNQQKTRSFFKRLEYGTTFQFARTSNFFPATTDIALSAGYKLNDNSVIGIGAGGKIGLGKSWKDITISGQGISLRSFLDLHLKGNWWISGGWEYNYQRSFSQIRSLYAIDDWKKSALLGLTKSISLKPKGLKKYRVQILYDFLHKQTLPFTEAIKFRMGYSF